MEILIRPYDGPGGGPLARYEMNLNGSGRVTSIVLPTADKASWRFGYGNGPIRGILCLHEVHTPTGGRETLDYGDLGHPYPGGVSRPNLPRVTRHRSYPGFGQPMTQVDFSYTSHNFLGFGETVSWEEGMDPLYKVVTHYEYGSTATLMDATDLNNPKVVRTVKRTYNRFHLLTEETTTQQKCIKQVKTDYYAEDKPFEQQVAQFQLPRKVTTIWTIDKDPTQYRAEVAETDFDTDGNQTRQVEPNGRVTTYTYYLKEGEDGCPPDRFVRNLKDTLVTPSPQGEPGAPTLRTRLRYAAHKALTGSGQPDWLAIESETLAQVNGATDTTLQQTQRTYHELPADAFLHGRPVTLLTTLNGKTSTTSYEYQRLNSALTGQPVLQTTELFTGFDSIEKSILQQHSLVTGEVVLSTDLDGVQLLRQFDALGRITREVVSPSSPDVSAERVYTYTLTSIDGQQASQSVTETTGATTHTRYDGMGRMIYQAYAEKSETPRQIFAASYDERNNCFEQISYDYWLEDKCIKLRQQFEYDAWGVECRTTNPDGSVNNLLWSPFGKKGPIEYRWLETPGAQTEITISGLTGGEYNDFGKLERFERLDAQPLIERCQQQPERPVAEHLQRLLGETGLPTVGATQFLYDGNSNCVEQIELYDGQERTTHFSYDVWERVEATTLADNTKVTREFAQQSFGQHVTRLKVIPGNIAQPEVTVGHQTFDSLLRLTERSTGSAGNLRTERYRYAGAQMQPSQRITALETFDYEYKPELTQQPLSIKTCESQPATYSYDPKTGGITKAINSHGQRTYRYSPNGQLAHESWTDTDGTAQETDYVTSLLGRQISRRDTGGLENLQTYDKCGRPCSVTQGSLKADFEYNALGQLHRTTTRNTVSGVTLVVEMRYDTQNREIERTLRVDNQPPRTIIQTWQGDNQLKSRQLSLDGRSLLKEEFDYDPRNRLVHHKCTGTSKALPKDAYGNAIISQRFTFDGLDNVKRVVTQFDNGLSDIATFTYAPDDPCQLTQITHTYTDGGYSPCQAFEYDANGNMLNDEQNRRLIYDSQGRLIAVKDPTGLQALVTYRYDGHNHLVGIRLGNERETLRFYQGYSLSHTRQGDTYTQYLFDGDRPLGQERSDDPAQTILLMTDASPHVIGEILQSGIKTVAYTAYGARSSEDELRSLLAFNCEVYEEVTQWYLLGRGYRAYNPNLQRFHSPDSFSPFGSGGVNPYVYGLGNPVTFRDPTGHRPTNDRPDDPQKDPVKETTGGLLGKIAAIFAVVLVAVVLVGVAWFTAGVGLAAIAAWGGAVLATLGAAATTYGVIVEDDNFVAVGSILVALGATVGSVGYFKRPQNTPTPRASVSSGRSRSGSIPGDLNEVPQERPRQASLSQESLNNPASRRSSSSIYDPSLPDIDPPSGSTNTNVRAPSISENLVTTSSENVPPSPIPTRSSASFGNWKSLGDGKFAPKQTEFRVYLNEGGVRM
ncbi:RHS repeat domain-containing protein [Pseudomonas sp. Leaf48]|uniref:RHS repeat domain-containing protein n=1 Tax=Pseudomonas sp. Leaf48 TaxID=1736221 RepID=UPI001F490960|nr:RHS repeat-associated core domain-containing protein [Pseudomonas sp. Leaf48]